MFELIQTDYSEIFRSKKFFNCYFFFRGMSICHKILNGINIEKY